MAGHSKWSKVKHFKGAIDTKRGNLFSRLSKEIALAARLGGGDPAGNARLRTAIANARAQSMPNDNIERAIKRGTGEDASSAAYEEMTYEGYAPGGVALMIEVATDNKNRSAADLRSIFTKNHGHLASSGSVAYLFKRAGQMAVPKREGITEDTLIERALEAGATDVSTEAELFVVTTSPDQLYAVGETLRRAGLEPEQQRLTYLPETLVAVADPAIAAQVLKLCHALEESDDVQHVHANFDIPEELMESLKG